ncbi:uncharacterized protein TRIVIDRAFT_213521 [Trichoderma virens Gv29-8]|uniref:Uncharacterized protein n=1 Tax=Hypocrea virens (strain Gv29-8 / FGSC 10586) TaxID=413071 RepID=G9N040_HYPVG|nr:uncharacterized protein TRIVIDRAFT_213521 [Trichoderma virens Gv29-8]EHK19722.1 hypothetical protein TRIVIDRAFT_213521 [Trichoderma virens Gv29-8]
MAIHRHLALQSWHPTTGRKKLLLDRATLSGKIYIGYKSPIPRAHILGFHRHSVALLGDDYDNGNLRLSRQPSIVEAHDCLRGFVLLVLVPDYACVSTVSTVFAWEFHNICSTLKSLTSR